MLGATAVVVAAVMALVVATDHQAASVPRADPVVGGWIKVVLAILLLAGAVRVALSQTSDEKAPSPRPATPRLPTSRRPTGSSSSRPSSSSRCSPPTRR